MANLVIATTDIHVHKYQQFNQNNRRLANLIDYINYLFELARNNDIMYILFSGDLYNNMQNISTEVENAVVKCFAENFRTSATHWIMISGNHDQATKNLIDAPAVSALEHLPEVFSQIWLLDHKDEIAHIDEIADVHGLPYYEFPEHFKQALEELNENVIEGNHKNILLMHQQIGAGGSIMPDILSPDDPLFKKFDFILNGHMHEFKEVRENFINVGSPLHRDAGDIGIDKGFLLMDLEDLSWNFMDISDRYPQYIHKTIGEEVTEEESKQYIVWVPDNISSNADESAVIEKFNTGLKPIELLTNFVEEIDPPLKDLGVKSAEELIEFGKQYL